MHQEIYVLKEDAAKLPQWEDFVCYVYTVFGRSLDSTVMDLKDGFPFLTFRHVDDETFVDAGVDPKGFSENAKLVTPVEFIKTVAPHLMAQPIKPKRSKRKKGPSRKVATVNKATITFCGGEQYTVKDFVSIDVTAENTIFIMEDNNKGTVNYRQAITVPNHDVQNVKVRGITNQFWLNMELTNLGMVLLHGDGVEIISSQINMIV